MKEVARNGLIKEQRKEETGRGRKGEKVRELKVKTD